MYNNIMVTLSDTDVLW